MIKKNYKKLLKYVDKVEDIYIMVHAGPDLDAIGSSIGLEHLLKARNKNVKIIFEDKRLEKGVKVIYESFKETTKYINFKDVENETLKDSLLFILDTNTTQLLNNSKLLERFKYIINVDHHDIGKNLIEADISVVDINASSTCEMITELYIELNLKPSEKVATALLAGIVLDTNSFSIKTTEKTFYVSYYLTLAGADNNEVRNLLKQDLKNYIERQKVITNINLIDNVAIAKGNLRRNYRKEDLAIIADSILLFHKVEASFVIGKLSKTEVGVSGRSYGKINVGDILSKYGGGGDEQGAATKTKDYSVAELYNALINDLKKYK